MKLQARYETHTYKDNGLIPDGDHRHLVIEAPNPATAGREWMKTSFQFRKAHPEYDLVNRWDFGPRYDHEKVIRDLADAGIEVEVK